MTAFNIQIAADPTAAVAGTAAVTTGLNTANAAALRLGNSIKLALGFLGVGLAVSQIVSTLRDFGQTMQTLAAVSGATTEEFRRMREQAVQLGATTRYTASQVGEAQVALARAGFVAREVLAATPRVLQLATAAAMDLGEAAGIVSNTMRGFRGETEVLEHMLNVLNRAANTSNTDIRQLGAGMSYVAPIAAGLGVNLEEVTAAAATLSDAGVQSTRFGTALTQIFNRLENPLQMVKDRFRELGLEWENMRPSTWAAQGLTFADVLQKMADAGITGGEALRLFSTRAGLALNILLGEIDKVRLKTDQLRGSAGSLQTTVDIMNDSFQSSMFALESAVEGVIIKFGELGGEKILRGFTDTFTVLVRTLTSGLAGAMTVVLPVIALVSLALSGISKVLEVMQPLVVGIGVAFALHFGVTAVKALAGMAGSVGVLKTAVTGLFTLIAAHPILALIAAIVAAGIAIYNFRDQIKISTGSAQDDFVTLGDYGQAVFESIGEAAGNFAEWADKTFTDVANIVSVNLGIMGENGGNVFDDLGDVVTGFAKGTLRTLFAWYEQAKFMFESLGKVGQITWEEFQQGLDEAGERGVANANAQMERWAARAREIRTERERQTASNGSPTVPTDPTDPPVDPNGSGVTFDQIIADLQAELDLLRLGNREREIEGNLLRIKQQLERDLTPAEEERARALLTQLQAMQDQIYILDELRRPQEEYQRTLEALNALLERGAISTEEYNRVLRDSRIAYLESQNDLSSGYELFLLELEERSQITSRGVADTLTSAFDQATDAIMEFVKTGKLSFDDLFASIVESFVRHGIENIIAQIFSAAGGGGGGGGFLQFLPFFFAGGGVMTANGPLPLNKYANGGVANSPQMAIYGEGKRPEAYVPLPDGRTIPVTIDGGSAGGGTTIIIENIDARGSTDPQMVKKQVQEGIREAAPVIVEAARGKANEDTMKLLTRRVL